MTDNLNLGAIDLGTDDEFIARHIGPRAADTQAMLQRLGYDSLDSLIGNVIPTASRAAACSTCRPAWARPRRWPA